MIRAGAAQRGFWEERGYHLQGDPWQEERYSCQEFYWRQSVLVPTEELRIRLTHRGIRQLTECAAIEERADGSELSVADSIAWKRTDDAVVVELVRKDLAVNQALLLRWDFARATA